jgi:hypothetical protein
MTAIAVWIAGTRRWTPTDLDRADGALPMGVCMRPRAVDRTQDRRIKIAASRLVSPSRSSMSSGTSLAV